jgi:hypothetical protein
MKTFEKFPRQKKYPRLLVVKVSDEMHSRLRRQYGRQAASKVRQVLVRNLPNLGGLSAGGTRRIDPVAHINEAARMLAGCYASLREFQRLVGSHPPGGWALVHADLSLALATIEGKIDRVCTLLELRREEAI